MIITKICIKCNTEKEINEFPFRKDNGTFRNVCKKCISLKAKIDRKNNPEKHKLRDRISREKNREKLTEYNKQYRLKNKESLEAKNKEKYRNNKEYYSEYSRLYREKNKEKIKQQGILYREKYKKIIFQKKKEYSEKNKDKINAYHRKYQKIEKNRILTANRRHKRRTLEKKGDVTAEQLENLYNTVDICYWCNTKLKKSNTHLDHYIPLSKGGEHTLSNLVISCRKCNLSKNAKDPFDFALSKGKLL